MTVVVRDVDDVEHTRQVLNNDVMRLCCEDEKRSITRDSWDVDEHTIWKLKQWCCETAVKMQTSNWCVYQLDAMMYVEDAIQDSNF